MGLNFTTDIFIKKAKEIHGDKYDYSLVKYTNAKTRVKIICPVHGIFEQIPYNHLSGKGCKECGCIENGRNRSITLEKFLEKAKLVHGDKYDYSKSKVENYKTKIEIICPLHGSFFQTPNNHLGGKGCKECGMISTLNHIQENCLSNTEDFIQKSKELHLDTFDYSKVDYINNHTQVKIICKIHGEFLQLPHNHLVGKGCRECGIQKAGHYTGTSKLEEDFVNYIKSFYSGEVITSVRDKIPPMELDIFLPEFNLGIEINGSYWHSEKFKDKDYHLNKYNLCMDKNIRLVSIWEWEMLENKIKIENFIKNLISKKIKLQARKLEIRNVNIKSQREFLDINHLQGYVSCSLALGLYQGDELVQIMTLRAKDKKNKVFEIGRLATKTGFTIIGGAERLFKNLQKIIDFQEIISYNNMDKFTGEVYGRLGMSFENISIPYGWIRNGRYLPRYATQKSKLIKQGYDKNLSESEIMRSEGFEKIYFTGVSKFVLKKEKP
nr:MAG TPA: endonuclease-like protein [Caudoviricetes sp.]